ncbi:MAG: PKD domain-containing protein [Planctomycetota bacterium]
MSSWFTLGRRELMLAVALHALALAGAGCSSGLSEPDAPATQALVASANQLQGFDVGTLSQPVTAFAATGGILPGSTGDRSIVFAAFATASPAGELIAPDPGDTNGASDVFLVAVANLSNSEGIPTVFNQELVEVFEHPRCQTCHGFPVTAPSGHPGGFDPAAQCSNCHTSQATGIANMVWIAPLSVGVDLDFRNKTAQEIVDQIEAWETDKLALDPTFDLLTHFNADPRIEWAITSGLVPLGRPTRETVPVEFSRFLALTAAWDAAGRPVTTEAAIESTVLVSQVAGGAAALAASSQPSITYVPAVAPGPADPVGVLFVAFVSSASNLPGMVTTVGARNVYRARVEVFLNPDDSVRLEIDPADTDLISFQAGNPARRCDDHCDDPAMGPDGADVAFESLASDLISGFVDGNAALPDLFIYHEAPGPALELLSASAAMPLRGGDGGSFDPAIDGDGVVVAFESDASDLISGDTNAVRDVFYRCLEAGACGIVGVRRASVATGGVQGVGGVSENATVARRSGVTLVAFESSKTNLGAVLPTATPQVYLHDDATGETTVLLSQSVTGVPGDGSSRTPIFLPDGTALAFETEASNLDDVRTVDANAVSDIVLSDLSSYLVDGAFELQRISVAPTGIEADGASTQPVVGSYQRATGVFQGSFATFVSSASNLGAAESTGRVLLFLDPNFNPTCSIQSPTVALTDTVVAFDASGTTDPDDDAISSYEWDFGDGGLATGATTTHTYTVVGAYDVLLTVTDARGARSSCMQALQVNFNNTPPTAVPGMVAPQAEDLAVNFDGSSSTETDPGDSIVQWSWDFGDGGSSSSMISALASHVYADPGTYTVTLTVTDTFGGTGSATTDVTIVANDVPTCTVTNVASVASGNTVLFTANVTDDGNPADLVYAWSVNGGQIQGASNASTLSVLYCAAATWSVSVTVTDVWGTSSSCTGSVVVTGAAVTFTTVYNTIINVSCNFGGCHDGVTQNPAMNGQATAFGNLVNQTGPALSCTDLLTYVSPGSIANSFLVEKVESATPQCGGQMPDGGPFLSVCAIDTIKAWILANAPAM